MTSDRLSVCMSCLCTALCSNGRRHRHNFFCTRLPHVFCRSCSNLDYIGWLLLPKLCRLPQSDPSRVDLSVEEIRWQIAVEWLQTAQWSQWRAYRKGAYRKLPSLFRMVLSLTPVHEKWDPKCTLQDQFRDACCHLTNRTEDIDKISFSYKRCRLCPSSLALNCWSQCAVKMLLLTYSLTLQIV